MENEKCLKNNFTKNYLINGIDFDANKHDLNSSFILSKMEDEYSKGGSLSNDDNDFFESDEYDYDSDCSLGSMNSLYLRLKDDKTFQNSREKIKQLQHGNTDLNKTDNINTNTMITKTRILEVRQFNDDVKDAKSLGKLNTTLFYGKQKSINQHIHTKQFSYRRHLKKICVNSKTIKSAYKICKLKHKSRKLHISLKNQQHIKHSVVQKIVDSKDIFQKNENFLRYKLQEQIPLLKLNDKVKIQISQNSEKFSITHKKFSENEKDFITDHKTITNENCCIESQVSDSNSFFINDFMDFDDFGYTVVVEDIVEKLFDEDDSITNNLATSQNN